ncbi:MAG: hypothetical protein ACJ748_08305, partial [Flavisolibacter sp.]
MEKVYLLLRNNLQTGPYTIDELLQQQLQPDDLIWVEGKSLAWSYPSEIKELSPTKENPAQKPQVSPIQSADSSAAADEIEKKAEELRKRAQSFSSQYYYQKMAAQNDGGYFQTWPGKENEAIEFIDHRKEKNTVTVEWITAGMVTVFVAASLYGGRSLFNRKTNALAPAATQIISAGENAAKTVNELPKENNPASGT